MATIYCLIPDIRGETILAVPAGAGCWTLPSFDQDIEWFAYAATAVARHASEHFGVAMTALHERSIADCKVCELEIQALQWTPPAGRWRLDAPYCEPDTDWGRAMRQRPATELRRLLADMDQYPC